MTHEAPPVEDVRPTKVAKTDADQTASATAQAEAKATNERSTAMHVDTKMDSNQGEQSADGNTAAVPAPAVAAETVSNGHGSTKETVVNGAAAAEDVVVGKTVPVATGNVEVKQTDGGSAADSTPSSAPATTGAEDTDVKKAVAVKPDEGNGKVQEAAAPGGDVEMKTADGQAKVDESAKTVDNTAAGNPDATSAESEAAATAAEETVAKPEVGVLKPKETAVKHDEAGAEQAAAETGEVNGKPTDTPSKPDEASVKADESVAGKGNGSVKPEEGEINEGDEKAPKEVTTSDANKVVTKYPVSTDEKESKENAAKLSTDTAPVEKAVESSAPPASNPITTSNPGTDAATEEKARSDLTSTSLSKYVSENKQGKVLDVATLTKEMANEVAPEVLDVFRANVKERGAVAVLLAAGQGSRFVSDVPKVIHPFCGKPLAQHSLDAAVEAGLPVIVVVGHARVDVVKTLVVGKDAHVVFVTQEEQMGTGHAVYMSKTVLGDDFDGDIFISYADNPGVNCGLLKEFAKAHEGFKSRYLEKYGAMVVTGSRKSGGKATGSYGRIVREKKDGSGCIIDIVEKKTIERMKEDGAVKKYGDVEWTASALDELDEFNSGIVVACGKSYLKCLGNVKATVTKTTDDGLKFEYYATDFVKGLVSDGLKTDGFPVKDDVVWMLEGTNTVEELQLLKNKMEAASGETAVKTAEEGK